MILHNSNKILLDPNHSGEISPYARDDKSQVCNVQEQNGLTEHKKFTPYVLLSVAEI